MAELPAGTEMVMPGDNVSLVIELITPVAMEKGLRFAIREGGRTVGAGTISGNHYSKDQSCTGMSSVTARVASLLVREAVELECNA